MGSFDFTKCKCFVRPWSPPSECFEYCSAMFLRLAKIEDLEDHLHLSNQIANRIFELTANEGLTMLKHFEPLLSKKEFGEVKYRLENLDERAFTWFIVTSKLTNEVEEPVPVS